MARAQRTYICIDLKTFYASVECADRGLDPFTTNLVVADPDRTEKTICLAVSPALKALGLPGRFLRAPRPCASRLIPPSDGNVKMFASRCYYEGV